MKNLKAAQWRAYAPIDLKTAKRFVLPYKLGSMFHYHLEDAKKKFVASEEGQKVVKKIKETFQYWLSPQCDIQDEELLSYLRFQATREMEMIEKLRSAYDYYLSAAAEDYYEESSLKSMRKNATQVLESNYFDEVLFDSVCNWRLGETMREPLLKTKTINDVIVF